MTSDTASCKVGSSTKNILQCSLETIYLRYLLPLLTVLPSIPTLPCVTWALTCQGLNRAEVTGPVNVIMQRLEAPLGTGVLESMV